MGILVRLIMILFLMIKVKYDFRPEAVRKPFSVSIFSHTAGAK